ncbi:M55 family metallopeptidase [Paenibacillus sp. GYB003]|uniref:M55 family metallopeptidase n=1 Tax=Paenibacillus sp. GYB003 TaxID=2994392 RepID=UPI002F965870
MNYLIMTDLEGVAGVDRFRQTRTYDMADKGEAMKQLARETNACIEGIREADGSAKVTVIDGHGTGGLLPDDLAYGDYVRYRDFRHETLPSYAGLFFVGQHAMAGTIDAPLCHTYSSLRVQYYRLNGVFIGEFAAFAQWAGMHGVPAVFLAGDDKAALEAQLFVPAIETAVTKRGKGIEAADHLSSADACAAIRLAAAKAARRIGDIPPFVRFQPPYRFEARHYEPLASSGVPANGRPIDERTYVIETSEYRELPFF